MMRTFLGRAVAWFLTSAILAGLPLLFNSGSALSMLSLSGIMVILALSYNLLYGQTGMLSFGQAVYYGLGGYIAVHVINVVVAHHMAIPAIAFPFVGGLGGLAFAALTGWFATKRSGTSFAMITLGLGELVIALSSIMTGFFGEEDGIGTNRTELAPFIGYHFGPQIQMYYLIAAWCLTCMMAMFAIRRTPFGLACSAVRDNSQRAEFVGHNSQAVRYMAFCIAGFFTGIAGALSVINFEIINATALNGAQSGSMLLMTYIGGTGSFFGPIIGAVLITFLRIMLSDYTDAWLMYYGVLFILVVMYLPGGIAGWLTMHAPIVRRGQIHKLFPSYGLLFWPLLFALVGSVLLIELSYHVLNGSPRVASRFRFFGIFVDGTIFAPWLAGTVALIGGAYVAARLWPRVVAAWVEVSIDGSSRRASP
jgi:branched-chain amino acid transport system permease protein